MIWNDLPRSKYDAEKNLDTDKAERKAMRAKATKKIGDCLQMHVSLVYTG